MTARFRNVAKGNISRLRDAQAFHAAVKRPPYFVFARQRRHFTAGAACPACAGRFWAWFVYGKTTKANAPRHRAFVSSQKIKFHHKFVSVWIKRIFVFLSEAIANNFDNFADIACVWARNMLK
ncbi:MAG TPA: hypothetical protein IAB15_01200 [Candidatus Ornithoclostridium faecigallinarum]|nr:hypothetical protein [Candidatus Ornithoclostridium faecigallinarum]